MSAKKSMLNNACETLSTQAIHVCIYIYDILTELVVTLIIFKDIKLIQSNLQ